MKVSNKMALNKTQTSSNTTDISNDEVVLNGVLSMASSNKEQLWTGTMTQLNDTLVKVVGKKDSKMLPRSPSALRVVLNRIVNRLRSRKIGVKFGRTTDHSRTRFVKFTF
jgi:hypothetical protein